MGCLEKNVCHNKFVLMVGPLHEDVNWATGGTGGVLKHAALKDVFKVIINHIGLDPNFMEGGEDWKGFLGEEGHVPPPLGTCMFLDDNKLPNMLGGWYIRQRRGYLEVRPLKRCEFFQDWPSMRMHRGKQIPDFVRLHWWVAHAKFGGLCEWQTSTAYESANRKETELFACHRCGFSLCVRPGHLALQTKYHDSLDREFHKNFRGHFRPSTHLE